MHILNYLLIFCTTFFLNNNLSADSYHTIQTDSGISKGIINDDVITWNDIPYAQPPTKNLRWMAPRDLFQPEKSLVDLTENFCVQQSSNLGGASGDADIVGQEDCLYLDIRAPKKNDSLKAVMFWIHGGGNTSGLKDLYDFSGLVKSQDVVVVSVNYRLGPFGWFSHPAIQDNQSGIDKTSNFGTLDIIKALEWVKKNIEKFGGDPSNITIFGESAGGHNVLSLLVAPQAGGLFHKAISQSGYTTSVSYDQAHNKDSRNINYIYSKKIEERIISNESKSMDEIRSALKNKNAYDFYRYYLEFDFHEVPLLTNDGIVIPKEGLLNSLRNPTNNSIPLMIGSNRDEVKLWIGTSLYFVKPKTSIIGSLFGVPGVTLKDEDAFEAFNYYRSSAWQIRGVKKPIENLSSAGLTEVYAYRYDWDDHRRWPVANFKKLIGAAHATEIPLLTGNNKLVGNYGFIIYPRGPSKKFTSNNMMSFWGNFAKHGKPGISSNGIEWENYLANKKFLILDKKRNLKHKTLDSSFNSLLNELDSDSRITSKEKCVLLYQLGVLIGNDIYGDIENLYPQKCDKDESIKFLKENSEFISY